MPITDAPPNWKTVEGLGWVLAADGRTVVLGAGHWTRTGEKWFFERAPEPEPEVPTTLDATVAEDLDALDTLLIGLRIRYPDRSMADLATIAGVYLGTSVTHDTVRQRISRLAKKDLIPEQQAQRARKLRAGRKGATPPSKVEVTEHLIGSADDVAGAARAAASGKRKARHALDAALRNDATRRD